MEQVVRASYVAVKQELLRRIQSREWKPGHVIPAEVELATEFGCARATVNRAMQELSSEGIIDRKRRAGTRVTTAPVRQARFAIPLVRIEVEATGASYRYALIDQAQMAAPAWLRAQLALPAKNRVLHVTCMHYAGNQPFQLEERWINLAVVPEILKADLSTMSPNEWLVNAVPFSTAEFSFTASLATQQSARFLALNAGDPVFVAERTTWLASRPITFARMTYRTGYRMTTRI